MVPRYCTADCTAYRSGDDVIKVATLKDVQETVNNAVDLIKDGMDWVDVKGLDGYKLSEILDM